MVLRFPQMPLVADIINSTLRAECAAMSQGNLSEYRNLLEKFHLLPNGDLFVDDDMDPEIKGILFVLLRSHGFLEENAEIIVPNTHITEPPLYGSLDDSTPPEPDQVVSIEDYLPDEAYDDGRFEEEMEEFASRDFDDEE